jgi:serine/threonine protein phosphatase PrpC
MKAMSDVVLTVSALTDVGMQRSGNEDAFLVADLTTGNTGLGAEVSKHTLGERGSLMIVSDGMGGAAAGEIASEMAVTTILEALEEMPASVEISERLKSAAQIANEQIWNHAQNNPELSGMGATLTAVLAQGTTVYVAQVGDSRAYLARGERIKQLTRDQSLAQMLVDSGAIRPEQMDSVPQNVIMQALGTQPEVKVAMTAVGLCRDDCLVICSDGLSNKVPISELRETVQGIEDPTEACRVLIEKANKRGGEDNITVIIARFDGEALRASTDGKPITGSFRALDRGYAAEYFSGNASAAIPQRESESPAENSQQITTLLKAPDFGELESTSTAAIIDDEFSSRPTAERPTFEDVDAEPARLPANKRGYAMIIIVALISLLLLVATGLFVYSVYMKRTPPPPSTEPSTQQE